MGRTQLADSRRCLTIGRLGEKDVDYGRWSDPLVTLVGEKYPGTGLTIDGESLLKWAKSRG